MGHRLNIIEMNTLTGYEESIAKETPNEYLKMRRLADCIKWAEVRSACSEM